MKIKREKISAQRERERKHALLVSESKLKQSKRIENTREKKRENKSGQG